MDWLTHEIATGFQKLFCLSLERTPAAEIIPGTVAAWVEAISHGKAWDDQRDPPRFREAFRTLARTARHWPAPADFLQALPAPPEHKFLPTKAYDPARAEAVIADLAKHLEVPHA